MPGQNVALCASHTEYQWFMAFMEVHALAICIEKAAFNLLTSFVAGQVSVSHPWVSNNSWGRRHQARVKYQWAYDLTLVSMAMLD